ncbi:hypothetical protein VIBNISO65_1490035 [Vibrio nigripulchritudo SO65]|nr:hypothetical protein VIBNIAM115_930035 [Vibrio nigripulchritudo AM115]CCN76031.1 hypothetical protein VIBNISO65_1490035 [Vibrio nigripulchritudo SO65]
MGNLFDAELPKLLTIEAEYGCHPLSIDFAKLLITGKKQILDTAGTGHTSYIVCRNRC